MNTPAANGLQGGLMQETGVPLRYCRCCWSLRLLHLGSPAHEGIILRLARLLSNDLDTADRREGDPDGVLRSRGAESSQSRSREREFSVERTGRHHQTEHLLMEDEAAPSASSPVLVGSTCPGGQNHRPAARLRSLRLQHALYL